MYVTIPPHDLVIRRSSLRGFVYEMGIEQSKGDSPLRIVVIGNRNDECLAELALLPRRAKILATGANIEELQIEGRRAFTEGNVICCMNATAATLGPIIKEMPHLVWIHTISAGLEHLLCTEIIDNEGLILTNAKGVYSNSLAEYVMFACGYFAKDVPRLLAQKNQKKWDKFYVRLGYYLFNTHTYTHTHTHLPTYLTTYLHTGS